ncbi:imidazolonepropionase [Flavobacteriaceae bacterium S356]|uniref:Imidazolonepropionase n=1 Tax=Asprobacillus argus TaxID=3076534 RepID=A0ABU3LEL5_9FLAO|nr:imidazolonepropionase [Flavobacteriaceae bacterium S356]
MTTLFLNIKELIQIRQPSVMKVSGKEMSILPTIKNAFLLIKDDLILDYGSMSDLTSNEADEIIDVKDSMILPSWCDSHTHLVFAGNREQEFVDRINGLSYEEIANRGGGILNSAKKLQETSEEELYEQSKVRLEELIALGTGAIEIKSGYGLTVDAEIKMLRVIKRLRENYSVPIKATFLGAHAVPGEFKSDKEAYLDLIIDEMLPLIAKEELADFIDCFCEQGYFSTEDLNKILLAGKNYGLVPKVHVNQFNAIGGIAKSAQHGALSVDHLEVLTDADLAILKENPDMISVALPSCSFFLSIPYTPARKIIDSGLALALASDFNPGSSPSGNMNFVVAAASIKMKMTPEEAINAATINGAYAMDLSNSVGSITKGKKANFIITKNILSYGAIPYNFGNHQIASIYLNGEKVV